MGAQCSQSLLRPQEDRLGGGSGCLTRAAGKCYAPPSCTFWSSVSSITAEGPTLAGTGSRVRKGICIGVVVGFVLLIAGLLVFSCISRTQTGDWWPQSIPSRAVLGDRSYGCDHKSVVPAAPVPGHHVGDTLFGGEIWAETIGSYAPTVIAVKVGDSMVTCELSGGP